LVVDTLLAVGLVLSTARLVSGLFDAVVPLPTLSVAIAWRLYWLSPTALVFQVQLQGADVLLQAVLQEPLRPTGY
jgi:hypothetical protein